jgi:hypothetical protein
MGEALVIYIKEQMRYGLKLRFCRKKPEILEEIWKQKTGNLHRKKRHFST